MDFGGIIIMMRVNLSWFAGCSSPDVTQRVSEEQCYLHPLLDRYQGDADYSTRYVQIVNNRVEETYRVLYNRTTLLPFMIEDHVDIGGTLIVQILFDHKNMVREIIISWFWYLITGLFWLICVGKGDWSWCFCNYFFCFGGGGHWGWVGRRRSGSFTPGVAYKL